MKILITGGAGFIGSHLSDVLLAQGHEVVVLDNLFTGSRRNLAHLESNDKFRFIEHDIVEPLPSGMSAFDQIYNLACPASPIHYQRDPVKTVLANTLGMINVLDFARSQHARILQTSTSEVYGDPLEHPQAETYRGNVNTTGPRACYDEGKRVAETLCFDYHRQYGVDIRVARIFNTYGPRMAADDGRVVSNFIVQALAGEPITIYGDGSQTRSFCYVDDLVAGLVMLMNVTGTTGPINIGNPQEFSVREIAEKIIDLTGSSSKIEFRPLPQDDPRQRRPDISLAKKILNWSPTISIEVGFPKTIEYFSSQK